MKSALLLDHRAEVGAGTREAWLLLAAEAMEGMLERAKAGPRPKLRVSVGWPLGRRKKGGKGVHAIGQCFCKSGSKDGVYEIFISPELDQSARVLDVLLHELIHAYVGVEEGHKGRFKTVAKAVGLEGQMTATVAGDELARALADISARLGPYPHGMLGVGEDPMKKKQGTRMLKLECPKCGYTARTTAKWLEMGTPTCPCGEKMEGEQPEEGEGDEEGGEG
jgi:hypothetical protein